MFDDATVSGQQGRAHVVADLRRRLGELGGAARWAAATPAVTSRYDEPPAGASVGLAQSAESAVLAAPGPLAAVLPAGGLPCGSIVSVGSAAPGGDGASSLLLALMAAAPGAWCAAVGLPGLGLLAAAELGVDLARLGLVPDPGLDLLQVISVLADGVDVIAVAAPDRLQPARQRVLTGRLRQGGAVLLVAGRWPGADLALTVRGVRWTGIGDGFGRLRDRQLEIAVGGRRAGAGMGAIVTLAMSAAHDAVRVDCGADGRDLFADDGVVVAGGGPGSIRARADTG